LARVAANRIVILTSDLAALNFWLIDDYFPGIADIDRQIMQSTEIFRQMFNPIEVVPVPVPHDCIDRLLGAYWRRPHAYLDADVRGAISTFSMIPDADLESGVARLRSDLENGTWEERTGYLSRMSVLDLGYRLVIAEVVDN